MATAMIAVVLFVSLRGLACMPEWCLIHLLNVLTLWEMKLSTFDSHGQPVLDTSQGLSLIPTAPPDGPKSLRLERRHVRVSVFGSPGEIRVGTGDKQYSEPERNSDQPQSFPQTPPFRQYYSQRYSRTTRSLASLFLEFHLI